MKHRLKYLAFTFAVFLFLGVGLVPPQQAQAAPDVFGTCSPLGGCSDPITGKPVAITKACPSSLGGFPTTDSPNLINLPSPSNFFVTCEIHWAQKNGGYVPGMPTDGGGGNSGVADYCHRNFTSTYLSSCNNGYADGAGAECGSDKACKVGAYARVQLDEMGQNNSTLKPTSSGAQKYCKGKTGKAHKACVAGYEGQINGKNKEDACKNLNGSLLKTCQKAWAQSKTDTASDSEEGELGCETNENALSWVICPTIDLLVSAINLTDGIITQEMVLPANDIFCTNASGNNETCDAYYTAWASFRNISLGLITIAGLIIIIAQAVGMEILDAYTIRKMLPRILVAALAITLSWPLMNFAVTLSNNLGFGVRDLIVAPFHNLDSTVNLNFSSSGAANLLGGLSALVIGGTLVAIGGLGILLSYVAAAGLAVLIAVMVLVLRQIVIIMLIIVSPIAIVAYVMPNTQRVFRLWWESFARALLMFPMIAGLIAAGRVFAAISLSGNNGDVESLLNQLVGLVAYFAPYFMIPLTFRFSGGIMSGMGNFVNQRGQGGFERMKKYRGEKYASNWKKARAGQRWDESFGRFKNPLTGNQTGIGHLANRMAVNVSDQDEYLPYRLGKPRDITNPLTGKKWGGVWGLRKGSAKMQNLLDDQAIAQSQKGLQEINEKTGGVGLHYEAWRGVSGQMMDYKGRVARPTAEDPNHSVPVSQALAEAGFVNSKTGQVIVPRSEQDFKKMGEILQQSSDDKERLGGNDLLEHRGTLATIKSGEDMEYADTQVMAAIAQAAAGRTEPDALANIGNTVSGRLGSGVGKRTMKAAQAAASRTERPDLRDGHGIIQTADGTYESSYSEKNYKSATAVGSVTSVKGSAWSGAKAEAVIAARKTIKHIATGGTGNAVEQRSVQDMIRYGIQNPYNDAGQRQAWMKIAHESGLGHLAELEPMAAADYDQLVLNMPDPEPAPGTTPPPTAG